MGEQLLSPFLLANGTLTTYFMLGRNNPRVFESASTKPLSQPANLVEPVPNSGHQERHLLLWFVARSWHTRSRMVSGPLGRYKDGRNPECNLARRSQRLGPCW